MCLGFQNRMIERVFKARDNTLNSDVLFLSLFVGEHNPEVSNALINVLMQKYFCVLYFGHFRSL